MRPVIFRSDQSRNARCLQRTSDEPRAIHGARDRARPRRTPRVGEGRSQQKTLYDPTAHGEIVAIRDACKRLGTTDLSGCEIYTTCEPCLLCVSAIWWAKISKMYYAYTQEECERIGFSTKALVDEVTRPLAARKLPAERICAEEANMLFAEWAASPRFEP